MIEITKIVEKHEAEERWERSFTCEDLFAP